MSCSQQNKTKWRQYGNKFNKDFKTSPHPKKNLLKKRQSCYSHEGDIIKTRKKDLVCAMKNLNKAKDINAD